MRHDAKVNVAGARRLVTMPVGEAVKLVEREAELLAERRAARGRTGRTGRMHRCQGCNAFMSTRVGCCHACGFRQDVGWAA